MTVEVLLWTLDVPKLARCSVCAEEWRRPRGRPDRAGLEQFAAEHALRHRQPTLFDPERPA